MKKFFTIAFLLLTSCATTPPKSVGAPRGTSLEEPVLVAPPRPLICFSPKGDCTSKIVGQIDRCRHSIYVQAYSFTSSAIAEALVRAHQRGVHVEVVLDRSDLTERGGQIKLLLENKVPTSIDKKHAIAHNKVMVLDEAYLLTGSFNFTASAESRNAENVIILQDVGVAYQYLDNWKLHRQHSIEPYDTALSNPKESE